MPRRPLRVLALAALALGLGGTAEAGVVDFVAVYDSASFTVADRAEIEAMFDQFEALFVADAPGTTEVVVSFVTGGTTAYAETYSNWVWKQIAGEWFFATNTWAKIHDGDAIEDAFDIEIRWNFGLSSPSTNIGLLRHELFHGFGAVSNVDVASATLEADGSVTKTGIGLRTALTVYDRALVDAADARLYGGYDAGARTFAILDFATQTGVGSWNDRMLPGDGAGVRFRGVDDEGGTLDLPIAVFGTTLSDWSHPMDVMYAGARSGTWSVVNDADRACLRGMGYALTIPEPDGAALIALGALAALALRK
jgi:hypothetical protein